MFYRWLLRRLVARVERSHFRTQHDTGANDCAMFIWNLVRVEAGLPRITLRDLPGWCEGCRAYHLPRAECAVPTASPVAYEQARGRAERVPRRTPEDMQEDHLTTRDEEGD